MKIKDASFVIIDTETTGLEHVDKVVDIALVEIQGRHITNVFSSLVYPGIPIPPEASAVHHLTDKHVADAPLWGGVLKEVRKLTRGRVVTAHNAAFDSRFLPQDIGPWLCTYRLARHLWPDLKSHANQYLRYYMGFDFEADAHRAYGDAYTTAHILMEELETFGTDREVTELFELCNSPIWIRKMPFGKYRGEDIDTVPPDYIEWALNNMKNLDEDLKHTFQKRLA